MVRGRKLRGNRHRFVSNHRTLRRQHRMRGLPADPQANAAALQFELGEAFLLYQIQEFFDLSQVQRRVFFLLPGFPSLLLHICMNSLGEGVNPSAPFSRTTTMSSIRTPPKPGRYTPGSIVITAPAGNLSFTGAATRGDS